MPRPASGSTRFDATRGVWVVRVTLANGARSRPIPMTGLAPCDVTPAAPLKGCPCAPCHAAEIAGRRVSDRMRSGDHVDGDTRETANEWHARYLERHESVGKETRGMSGTWARRVAPFLGTLPIATVKPAHIKAVRDALTAAVVSGEIGAKRAMNLWSELVVAPFSRAFTDDDPQYATVHVGPASANPAASIKPPVTKAQLDEDRRERQPMYPHEFAQIMNSAAIPVEARRIYALAAFLYTRPQEFYALRWSDVDWHAREVRVRRKLDVRTGEEKPGAKSDAGIREVPIHPNLMPLLEAMHDARESDDERIVPLIGSARLFERFADQTRRHLVAAGIKRQELIDGTADLMPFDFRSWRTTGCTWLAMLGTDSYVIALQAGHKSPDVTWGSYIKRGPDLRQRHGEPFPPLPAALLEKPDPSSGRVLVRTLPNGSETQRRGRDSNPRQGFSPAPA